jgi:hypothetical protein
LPVRLHFPVERTYLVLINFDERELRWVRAEDGVSDLPTHRLKYGEIDSLKCSGRTCFRMDRS